MHTVIRFIDHIKNADNWVAAILDMQISECNVISGYVSLETSSKLFLRELFCVYQNVLDNSQVYWI